MKQLVILSGAGLSAESGIATFRDNNGLWEQHNVEDICNINTWRKNYDLVHRFYSARRVQLGQVEPNLMHQMMAKWEARYPTTLLTQNVDDLLERAGCQSVVHVHGFLTRMHCTACNHRWEIGYTEWGEADCCPVGRCANRASVKPSVVFFGEAAPNYTLLFKTLGSLKRGDVFLVVGTMGTVLPVDSMVRNAPCTTILNNLEASEAIRGEGFDHVFYEPATQAAPKIDALLKNLLGAPL